MRDVVIFGTGSFAQVASVYLSLDSDYRVAAFTVHSEYIREASLRGLPVKSFETICQSHPPQDYAMFVAIGFSRRNRARSRIYALAKEKGYEMISYVSSKALIWDEVPVGDNCFIFENNVIQPFVSIGNNTVIWGGSHIGHHSVIGNHCFIAPHAVISGNCTIEDGCFIGVNATVRDGIRVTRNSLIGAGSLILHDTIEGGIYKGLETFSSQREDR